jgi:hypothetical protein
MKPLTDVELHIMETHENSEKHFLKLTIKAPPKKIESAIKVLKSQLELKEPLRLRATSKARWKVTVDSKQFPISKLKFLALHFWELLQQTQ